MKFRRRPLPLLVLVLPALSTTLINALPTAADADSVQLLAHRDTAALDLSLDKQSIGTKDAPVDGKDGRPHAGPWVETEASRDRQKAKEAGEDVVPLTPIAPPLKDKLASLSSDGERTPQSNDGVMDDPHRVGPKEGTRGTEGGVSEKSRESRPNEGKRPDPPKEAPPLPHSEQQKVDLHEKGDVVAELKGSQDSNQETQIAGLEKPDDLPEKPHDIPIPNPPSSSNDDSLDIVSPPSSNSPSSSTDEHIPEIIQPIHSFFLSFAMILFSEVGDKTFLVAALMAMRHPRMVVFSAAFSALIAMTILSAVLGHAVPTLIPKHITNFAAAALFLVFGLKMLREGRNMSPDEGVGEEMKEVEMELEEKEHQQRRMSRRRSSITPYMLESGRAGGRKSRSSTSRLPSPPESPSSSSSRENSPSRSSTISNLVVGVNNLFSLLLSPAWVQTFVMTFLGEWGDRSQIATIAMAAGQDYWWVTGGAVLGHSICTGGAVLGGRAIAGKVSMRVVTLGGAVAFLVFGVIYLFEAIY